MVDVYKAYLILSNKNILIFYYSDISSYLFYSPGLLLKDQNVLLSDLLLNVTCPYDGLFYYA